MKILAALMLLCGGIAVYASGLSNGVKLPIDGPFGDYRCFIRNDTITVITQGKSLYLYKIVGDRVVDKVRLGVEIRSQWAHCDFECRPSSIDCLYEGTNYVHLYELFENGKSRTSNTKIPIFRTSSYYLIPFKGSHIVIFSAYNKRFTLNSHSLSLEYDPLAYCKVTDGVASGSKSIESGRVNSHSLQNVVVHDTIFAVWEQCEHKSFMTWVTDIKNSLVFSTFSGNTWSKPEIIYDNTGRQIRLLGMYELKDQLYCFWTQETTDGKDLSIFYVKTADRSHWSAPVELTKGTSFANSWLACNDGHNRLHLVISDTEKGNPSYFTFDGRTLEYKYELELQDAYLASVAVDKGKAYLFYSRQLKSSANAGSGRITENFVTEKGDTVRVDIINPDHKDEERAETELFVVPL